MRQLMVEVPRGQGGRVLEVAERHDGTNLARLEAIGPERELDLAIVHLPNQKVEGLIEALQDISELRITLLPQGIITLRPPPDEAPQQAIDIQPRSPFEIFYAGLQSVGSWKGFLGYAVLAGFVVWIGLYTNAIFLLVAAMLIAPFAGPAMTVALGTARGDANLLRRGTVRYFASLAVTVLVNFLMSLAMRQEIATEQMIQTSEVSSVAVVLALAAGAAGALNLVQSERNSLVSGAAVGMLVAASLAPPAGMTGMAMAIGEWGMVQSALFLLALQLLGINLTGTLVFRLYGLTPRGARYERGKRSVFAAALAGTLAAMAGVLWWQFSSVPDLQRSSRAQRATAEVKETVNGSGLAQLVEANVRFTRADIQGQNTLLGTVYVQRRSGVALPAEEIRSQLTRAIQERLLREGFNVTPLIDVSVLEPPPGVAQAASRPRGRPARE